MSSKVAFCLIALMAFCAGVVAGRAMAEPTASHPVDPSTAAPEFDWPAIDTVHLGFTAEGVVEPTTPIPPGKYRVTSVEVDGKVRTRARNQNAKLVTLQFGPRSGLHMVKAD